MKELAFSQNQSRTLNFAMSSKSVVELRAELEKQGHSTEGKKADLVARLLGGEDVLAAAAPAASKNPKPKKAASPKAASPKKEEAAPAAPKKEATEFIRKVKKKEITKQRF